jgi:gamma-glutamyl-gamma-aminobutyrate hydrolase PuuD
MAGDRNLHAVAEVAGALPLIFAGDPKITHIPDLLDTVDGIVLTGARANVHPTRFHTEPSARYEPYDEARDALALPLIEACVERGVPVFGICRGFQEMNVAFGGSLHPEIRELPGHINHRMPRLANGEIHPDPAVVFADRHKVQLTPGGVFARLFGRDTIKVNASSRKASRKTARSRRSASRARRASRSACSGMPNTTRPPTPSTVPCSKLSAVPFMPAQTAACTAARPPNNRFLFRILPFSIIAGIGGCEGGQ